MLEKILAASENEPPPLVRPKSRRTSNVLESRGAKEIESPKTNKSKPKPLSITKKAKEENKITCQIDKLKNESTMSLDSLDDHPSVVNLNSAAKRCQSIGINTELLCIPCVIHDSIQEKNVLTKCRGKITDKVKEEYEDNLSMHMLFKNPMMTSSCDIQSRKLEQELIENTSSKSILSTKVNISNDTLTLSDEIVSYTTMQRTDAQETMSSVNAESYNSETTPFTNDIIHELSEIDISKSLNENNIEIPLNTDQHNSEENFDDSVEDNNNCIINTYDDDDDENIVTSRHGSGETYTKFTENPNDFEEFMNETDKMIELKKHEIEIDNPCFDLHTPNTSSLISMNKSLNDDVTERTKDTMKHNFSDTLKELKRNFQQLLKGAGDAMDVKKDESNQSEVINTKLKASDFEHITLFGVNDVDKEKLETLSLNEEVKLPTIHEKRVIDKKRVQRIYKPNRKYKMLGEGSKNKNDFKTFIVQEHTEDSDSQSITAEAPPLKLPRIDNNNRKRTSGFVHLPYIPISLST
ncbi:MATH and LRR domain-containing protein PFE0570w-like [Plutella xylostella]|uniref:MATH and LRR domain-containing protein PFE0570w-like n=1 Tax=Plutella xylostella TaxID=51655 RepID=UPI0020321AB7|nr:MATH and LRR domain-containing protein PFE0570w-like [Plutella xylostella]